MNIVFMGTPPFALSILKALHASDHHVTGVVSQPDRPKGRGRKLTPSPVSEFAIENTLPLIKPQNSKDPILLDTLHQWRPDLCAVAAFGQILKQNVLDVAPLGNINVHASLLPAYRGAAPIQRCLINGDTVSGNTTMMMDAGMDTGDMLLKSTVQIPVDWNAGDLEDALAKQGGPLLLETLSLLESGKLDPKPQDNTLATYAPMLNAEDGHILWNHNASETHNRIRGCNPRPSARAFLEGEPVRILASRLTEQESDERPGTVIGVENEGIMVVCEGGSAIILEEIQPAGRNRMTGAAFLRGYPRGNQLRFDTIAP